MDVDFDCQPATNNKAISSIYSELLKSDDQLNRRPAYQRSPVWDEDQKSNLVDSIMKKCPMPVFLLYCYESDTPEPIDGQNRLTAIKEYIEQTPSESCVPWAWVRNCEDQVEFVFCENSTTREAMLKYCESKTKPAKGSKKPKVYRLMTPTEIRRFNGYQCTISEIKTKLTFDQRKDIFLRWQSGTGISQCDRFKNEDDHFSNYVIEHDLERTLSPRITECLKTGRKNWLWDLYRLINVFYDGNTEPASVFISTIKSRTRIRSQTEETFSPEETRNAVKRCEKFLGRFPFLNKIKGMYISFLLEIAFLWNSSPPQIRVVMEQEEFLLKFAEANLGDMTMTHNTLNNGPNETAILASYPQFRMAFMVAYDEQKPVEATSSKKKGKADIPSPRKTEVWNIYIGEAVGKAKCVCCGIRDITARDFNAGHVISDEDGGTIEVSNLRPICGPCNSSMGSRNMIAWMKRVYSGNTLVGI